MARPLRIVYPGAFYHITSRGNEQKPIFRNLRDRKKFQEYLESATNRYDAVIHAYCLMNNHYHLLMETPAGNLPQIMHHINGAYTTYFNIKWARKGHLFQGRYMAILVEQDEYAKGLSRYIHLNPVRAGMVETPEQYQWSSYSFYVGWKRAPGWLQRRHILGYFGQSRIIAQKNYRKYVFGKVGKKLESPLKHVVGSVLLGSQAFIDDVKAEFISGKTPERSVPAVKCLQNQITIKEISEMVDSEIPNHARIARKAKIFLCRKHTAESLRAIGAHFRIGDTAVAQSYSRFISELKTNRRLRSQIEKIEKTIKK